METTKRMMFSFIIGTLNRTKELKYCIDSLIAQEYKEYEIIIVDQSNDESTRLLVENYKNHKIVYNHVDFKGLSKARNYAIKLASGDYICLADDDACYDPRYLSALKTHYEDEPLSIISGYMWDAVNKRDFINYSKIKQGKSLSVRDIIRKCPSPAITFPKCIIDEIDGFDESFGVGAKYGAGEETDFLLRAFWKKYKIVYWKDVKVKHPHEYAVIAVDEAAEDRKAENYPFGIGAMYKKQFFVGNKRQLLLPYLEQKIKMHIKKVIRINRANVIAKRFEDGFNLYKEE